MFSQFSGVFLHISRVQAFISSSTWCNWTQSAFQFHTYFADQRLPCCKFGMITPFSEREIFFLFSFFSPESSSPTVFSVWLGNHVFVFFLGYSADIPCQILCSDRAVGKWEALFLKEKTHQVAWPLNKEKKNARSLKKTNSSLKDRSIDRSIAFWEFDWKQSITGASLISPMIIMAVFS